MINKIKNFFLITLGILFLIFLFYRRLIELRLPKALYFDLFENERYIIIGIYVYLVIVFGVMVSLYVKKILEIEKKSTNIIIVGLGKISYFLNSGLKTFHAWLINIPFIAKSKYIEYYTYKFPVWLGLKLYHFYTQDPKSSWRLYLLFIVVIMIPKSIVFLALAIDVYYYGEFRYVYKVSFLLLIPLIERFLYFTFKEFIEGGCEIFDERLEIIIINKKPQNTTMKIDTSYCLTCLMYKLETPANLAFRLTKEHKAYIESLPNAWPVDVYVADYMDRIYDHLHVIDRLFLDHQLMRKMLVDKFHLILYFNYTILWIYVLIYSF